MSAPVADPQPRVREHHFAARWRAPHRIEARP